MGTSYSMGALYDAKIFKELRFPCGRHYEDEYVFVSVFENQECVVCIRRIYTTIYNVQIPLWELLIKNRIAWIILKCGMSG